jgi:hypothetical protein
MGVDIDVNLDVDLDTGLEKIKRQIKNLEDDLDFKIDDIVSGEIDADDLFSDDIDINDIVSGELEDSISIGSDDDDKSLGINDDRIVSKLEEIRRGLGQGSVSRGRLPLTKTLSQRVVGDREKKVSRLLDGRLDVFSSMQNLTSGITGRSANPPDLIPRIEDQRLDVFSAMQNTGFLRLDTNLSNQLRRLVEQRKLDSPIPQSFLSMARNTEVGDNMPINPGEISPFRADRYDFRTSNFDASTLDIGLGNAKDGIIDRELREKISERTGIDFGKVSNAKKAIGMSDMDNRPLLRMLDGFDAISDKADTLKRVMGRLKPTMGRMYQIVALLLPAIGALAVQMGSLAIAAGGLVALGGGAALLGALGGEADTLAGSVSNLETQMGDFKKALFQAIQPAADQFAPLFNSVLESIVTNVGRVADKMRAFDNMEGFLTAGIRGAATMFNDIADAFLKFKPQIKAVTAAIGALIVSNAGNFFEALIKEGLSSVDTIMMVLNGLFMLGRVVFAVLKNVLNFVAVLSGLSGLLSFIADILGNRFVQAGIIVISVIGVLIGLLYVLAIAVSIVSTNTITLSAILGTSFIQSVLGAIPALINLITTLGVLETILISIVALASAITFGAVLFGALSSFGAVMNQKPTGERLDTGGGSFSSMGNTNITNNNTFNVKNPDETDMQAMKDIASGTIQQNNVGNGEFSLR